LGKFAATCQENWFQADQQNWEKIAMEIIVVANHRLLLLHFLFWSDFKYRLCTVTENCLHMKLVLQKFTFLIT